MTLIEWTDTTWNPVTGCSKVSPGCDRCYMFALYPRLRAMGVKGYQETPDTVQLQPHRLNAPRGWRKPRRVFVCSMADLFHSDVPFDYIDQVFEIMVAADHHTYQVLTKRPGRAVGWWEQRGASRYQEWPDNVWMGTSVELQKYRPRIEVLSRLPGEATKFVSAEPLLEWLDLSPHLDRGLVDWLIVGGESGPGARPMDLDWARTLRDQAEVFGVQFFLKQLGGWPDKRGGDRAVLDGRRWEEHPV